MIFLKYLRNFFEKMFLLVVILLWFINCSQNQLPIEVHEKLSEYNLFRNIDGKNSLKSVDGVSSNNVSDVSEVMSTLFDPADRVIHYDLIAPLFTDYSLKYRTVYMPEGTQAIYREDEVLEFPVGTIISKTFFYVADYRSIDQNISLIETRLLIHQPSGWEAFPYYWNEDKTDATLLYGGRKVAFNFINEKGDRINVSKYEVPVANACSSCHHSYPEGTRDEAIQPIGPEAINLNKKTFYQNSGMVNQLEHLSSLGMLSESPDITSIERKIVDYTNEDLDLGLRARSFLHGNCASCHRMSNSAGVASELFLNIDQPINFDYGICKKPGSAGSGGGGFEYDIVPGNADISILVNRIRISSSGRMPPLGRSVVDKDALILVKKWIDGLTANDCSTN